MSVLIRGMEMPTSCRDCRFCNGQANTDYGVCAWCDVDGKARDAYTMQDCPLVPVPPHGRLIEYHAAVHAVYDGYKEFGLTWRNAEVMLGKLPTIIPAEEGE